MSRSKSASLPRRVLILGGARSGKSSFAESLAARRGSPVTVLATALPLDDDMGQRIAAHRASRPTEWSTIEEPLEIAQALARIPSAETAVVDCITVWLGNMFHQNRLEADIMVEVDRFLSTMSQRRGSTLVVSNEVGLGVVPTTELGRTYRDVLGRVNRRLASDVDRALLMVAGRALDLHDVGDVV
jgi:adenosylcobinamide kinase/adenosylcobinamide-phosphate guanylyltransferase